MIKKIMYVRFFPKILCNMYVTLCMPVVPVWVFGVSFCGSYCPNVIVFLAFGGIWRCEHALLCVEIVKRHLSMFIHSYSVLMRLPRCRMKIRTGSVIGVAEKFKK